MVARSEAIYIKRKAGEKEEEGGEYYLSICMAALPAAKYGLYSIFAIK